VFWARATSASMLGPILGGTTDHIYAQLLTYRGVVNSGNPWDTTAPVGGVKAAASTAVTVTGVTTTYANAMVVQAVARDNDNAAAAFSAQTNANLSSIAERVDAGTTNGNGGGFSVWDGTKVAAGATGNTTATVTSSIDAFLTVALKPAGGVAPDHYELSLATDSVSCVTTSVTVTACANSSSPCTSNYTAASGTTATLATSAGTLGTTSVTFNASGVATTTLNYAAAADGATAIVTLSGEALAATNPRKCCPNGVGCAAGNTCTTTFKTAGFIFADTAGGDAATVLPQVAGTASASLYLRAVKTSTTTLACEAALSGANSVNLGYTCSNPASCSAGNLLDITPYNLADVAQLPPVSVPPGAGAVTLYFDAGANAKLLFNYRDAGRIQLNAGKAAGGSLLTALSGSSNAFVTKPWGFSLVATCADATVNAANQTTPSTGDPKFCRAGQNFNATATAITQAGIATPNYGKETEAETVSVTWTRQLPAPGEDGTPPSGVLPFAGSGGVFGPLPPLTPFIWNEVGILKAVVAVGVDGDYLGAGNVSSTAYVGRFYPDHFNVEIIPQLGCSGFVYAGRPGAPATLGQPFTVKATAKNGLGSPATTINYNSTGGFSKNVNLTLTTGGTGVGNIYVDATAGGTGAIPASKFAAGVGQVNYNDGSGKISYVFDNFPTMATPITLRADDAESAISPMVTGASVSASARSGRLRLSSAAGSPLLNLTIPAETQYYDGTYWTINALDSCSTADWAVSPVNGIALQGSGASGDTTVTRGPNVALGVVTLSANAPGSGGFGYKDFSVTVPDYLKFPWTGGPAAVSPGARASFGVRGGSKRVIERRERY
jgi:MSHA biogenesis protein MshQ